MEFEYLENRDKIGQLYKELLNTDIVSLDIETDSTDIFTCNLLLIQLELNDKIFIADVLKLKNNFVKDLISYLYDAKKIVIGHNIKFDIKVLFNQTGILLENLYDTMIGEVLTYNGVGNQYPSYKDLVEKYFNITIDKDVRKTFENHTGNFTNEQLIYSALDVKYLKGIRNFQLDKLREQKQLIIEYIESRLIAPVSSMELNGVLINRDLWVRNINHAEESLVSTENKILDYIFNNIKYDKFNSLLELVDFLRIPAKTKKLRGELDLIKDFSASQKWLRDNYKISSHSQLLPVLNYFGVKVTSTNEKVLKPFENSNELVKLILEYRESNKKITTYGDNVLEEVHPKTGRLHVDYNQLGTYTGRFTVSRLHQIPREQKYRECFIAKPDFKIITADYNQQEYRLAGALTGDKRIIESYQMGLDMHTSTASLLYKLSLKEITKEQRNKGKSINFATLYWSSVYGLAYNLNISIQEAEEIISTLEKGYPTFFEFREYAGEMIWKHKKAVTPLGRVRFFPEKNLFTDAKEYEKYIRKIKKEGFNHMIQGWGADITKMAMNNIYYENPFGDNVKFYIQLHDEIDTEVYAGNVNDIANFVEDGMLKAEQPQLKEIPAKVEYIISDNWVKG